MGPCYNLGKKLAFFTIIALGIALTGCDDGVGSNSSYASASTAGQYTAPQWNLSVQAIQEALKTHPLVKWTPGQTYITNLYNATQAKILCGLDFASSSAKINQGIITRSAQIAIPPRFSWRNNKGKDWLTPIKYQDAYRTSVAFACVAAIEASINISQGYPSQANDLSECYLWNKGTSGRNPKTQGWNYDLASSFLKDSGTVLESASPNSLIASFSEPSPSAVPYKITAFNFISGKDAMKEALLKGPLVSGMSVFEDFYFYQEGIYRHLVGNYSGEQAIVIIGYEEDNNCWICRNSWSENWGEKGNFRIFYDEVRTHGYLYSYPATSTFISADSFPPETPTILSPVANQTGVSYNPTLQSTAFSDKDDGDTHSSTEWEIYLGEQVLAEKRAWYKFGDSANKTTITVDSALGTFENSLTAKTSLDASQTYTAYVRYRDEAGSLSSWSYPVRFSTAALPSSGPWKPYLISPTANQASFPLNPFLISSAFKSSDPTEKHLKTDWEIYDNQAISTTSRVWYKLEDNINIVSVLVDGSVGLFENSLRGKTSLSSTTNYWTRVRYFSSNNTPSAWSDLVNFSTGF